MHSNPGRLELQSFIGDQKVNRLKPIVIVVEPLKNFDDDLLSWLTAEKKARERNHSYKLFYRKCDRTFRVEKARSSESQGLHSLFIRVELRLHVEVASLVIVQGHCHFKDNLDLVVFSIHTNLS